MVHDLSYIVDGSTSYFVERSFDNIYYGKGFYHRLHLISTKQKWRPVMYLRDDKLKEYTKEQVKAIYDQFIKDQKLPIGSSHNPGEILFRDEGAFLRCFDNSKMIGFLHIPDTVMNDLKERLTVDYITKVAQEVFEQDADFGLYYCDSICPPEANFADYYFNWSSLEIRTKTEFEAQSLEEENRQLRKALLKMEQTLQEKEKGFQTSLNSIRELKQVLQECQESLRQMAKYKGELEDKVKTLEEMEETRKRENQQLEEEVKKLKEQQQKMTIDDETTA